MPILHFSGKFKSNPPYYNNYPLSPEKYFDPNLSPKDVKEKITDGVEPLQYFEFEFDNVYIKKITYDDGAFSSTNKEDAIVGREIKLKGLLVDTSPHLIRGRLFAGEIRVLDFVLGKLNVAVQSDLFRTIREAGAKPPTMYSADFESDLYDIDKLNNEFVNKENSRFLRELNGYNNLKVYFNTNLFDPRSLQGKVYGYLGSSVPIENKRQVRIQGRRLMIDPAISSTLKQDFGINDRDLEPVNDIVRNDLEGTYEIIEENRLAIVRYLNFIPFSVSNHNPPQGYKFYINYEFENERKTEPSLSPNSIKLEIENEESISQNGGICVFRIPGNITEFDKFRLSIKALKDGDKHRRHSFLVEPIYDLILDNNQKFLTLESGLGFRDKKRHEVQVRVYKNNKLSLEERVELILKTEKNDESPTVAWWNAPNASSANGIAACYIETLNLENNSEGVEDPVLNNSIIIGELPWDRYYGNYVSLKIESSEKPAIKVNVPVRVLHSVSSGYIESVDNLEKEQIQDIVTKMLSYYTRYYPWLHVDYQYTPTVTGESIDPVYDQFLKIKEYLNFIDTEHLHAWHSVKDSVDRIDHFLDRLTRDENDWRMMPRSRDFPINGVEFLKAWKASMINLVIKDISDSKNKIINGENNKDLLVNDMDLDNWEDMEDLINGIENLISFSSSLSPEHKKLLLKSKLVLYDLMLEKLGSLKVQTTHSHHHH